MSYRHPFPRTVDKALFRGYWTPGYRREAAYFVEQFTRRVIPLLQRFGLDDDEHLRKYLTSETFEDIYKDIIASPTNKVLLQNVQELDNDFWINYREAGSEATSPEEEGFVFLQMPYGSMRTAKIWIDAISVKDGQFSIDKEYIEELCVIKPTERQQAAYDLAAQFCEGIAKLGYEKKNILDFFITDQDGKNIPYAKGIIFSRKDPFH